MEYDAILFDFDYTLADSSEGIILCANVALREMGLPEASGDDIRRTIGLSLQDTYARLTGDTDKESAEAFRDIFIRAADMDMSHYAEFYPYSLGVLDSVRSAGLLTGVVTTKFRRRITEVFEMYGAELPDVIVGGDGVTNPKPDPEGLFKASECLDVPVSRILYVGDSDVDAKAAGSAGMDFIGVLTGNTAADVFSEYPHKAVIKSLADLPATLNLR